MTGTKQSSESMQVSVSEQTVSFSGHSPALPQQVQMKWKKFHAELGFSACAEYSCWTVTSPGLLKQASDPPALSAGTEKPGHMDRAQKKNAGKKISETEELQRIRGKQNESLEKNKLESFANSSLEPWSGLLVLKLTGGPAKAGSLGQFEPNL